MKIETIRIQNLRAFEDETVDFGNYTTLVGANGAGKSTILCALNIFFRETENSTTNTSDLDVEDFHLRDTSKPIVVTVTFSGLSDADKERFAAYSRQGRLTITAEATFDEASQQASVIQYGERLAMQDLAPFFAAEKDGEPVAGLRQRFAASREKHPDIRAETTKDNMRAALREYEDSHPELCELKRSSDQFYGFTKGANRLAECVQWVYVPAVKDATKEQLEGRNTAFGRLLARKVRGAVKFDSDLERIRAATLAEYEALLAGQQATLAELAASLQTRLGEWAHPEATVSLAWSQDPKKAVSVEEPVARMFAGEGDFQGELARFGHGLQRSYLLALLQELAAGDVDDDPTLILAIEEPELYQHPPQARHLAGVLQALSTANAQVVISTHSPHFVTGEGFEAVRMVRRVPTDRKSVVRQIKVGELGDRVAAVTGAAVAPLDQTQARLSQALQPALNEMFFTPRLILVEGLEDIAYITSWLVVTNRWDDFRRRGCHLVAANGKSELIRPLIVAQGLGIPTYVVFDADGDKTNPGERVKHERDNTALLRLLGGNPAEPFPAGIVSNEAFTVWPVNLGSSLQGDVGGQRWDRLRQEAGAPLGNPAGFEKNSVQIGLKMDLARRAGDAFPSLDQLCERILGFG